MLEKLVLKRVMVKCSCGQEWPVANPDLEESIMCGVCGKKIYITEMNTHSQSTPPPSALFQAMENMDSQTRLKEGIRLAKEGKFGDALQFYRSIVLEVLSHRDAFYGLGYCYYKMGRFEESFVMLGMAAEMGHPTAELTLKKVRERLGIFESESKA